jgi:hypothetical protein
MPHSISNVRKIEKQLPLRLDLNEVMLIEDYQTANEVSTMSGAVRQMIARYQRTVDDRSDAEDQIRLLTNQLGDTRAIIESLKEVCNEVLDQTAKSPLMTNMAEPL